MRDLREQLSCILQGHACLVGVGNVDAGDDGAGVRLAEAVAEAEIRSPKSEIRNPGPDLLLAGLEPERHLGRLTTGDFDHVVFFDAVDCGAEPGAVVLLNAGEMASRFPQVSTHRLSLGLLGGLIQVEGRTRSWLLGIQPGTLRRGNRLSDAAQTGVDTLAELLRDLIAARHPSPAGERGRSCPLAPGGASSGWADRNVRAPIGFTAPEPGLHLAPC